MQSNHHMPVSYEFASAHAAIHWEQESAVVDVAIPPCAGCAG